MTTLTLCHVAGAVGEEPYHVYDGDRYVGHVHRADTCARWFWGLDWEVTEPANPPYGNEPTREAAMTKFEAAFVALRRPES